MKKIIVMLAVLFAIGVKEASAQRISFYYYPSSNVYFNISTGNYIYYDPGVTTWVTVQRLPATIVVTRTPRYIVYYNGPEVWRDNGLHKGKYKAKKTVVKKSVKKNNGKGRS